MAGAVETAREMQQKYGCSIVLSVDSEKGVGDAPIGELKPVGLISKPLRAWELGAVVPAAVLIAAFRRMHTPTCLAYASAAGASDKILYRQQQFLDRFQQAIGGPRVHSASIMLQTDSDNVLRRWAENEISTYARRLRHQPPSAPGRRFRRRRRWRR